jgi:pimeloyl-ACP methyl ester carboxylesterase
MAFFHFQGQFIAYQLIESEQPHAVENSPVAETLVFLHGLGADMRQVENVISSLHSHRILTLDMPGHGQTVIEPLENFEHWYCFETFSDIVIALLEHLSIHKAIIGGISMGAGISVQVALKQPELVDGLILVRPAWLDSAAIPNLSVVKSIGENIQKGGLEWAAKQLDFEEWFQKLELINPSCAKSIKGLFTRQQSQTAAAVLNNLVNDAPFKQLSQLTKIQQPTVVFSNDADPLHPNHIAVQIAELIPNASYSKLPSRYLQPQDHQVQLIQLTNLFLTSDRSQCRRPVANLA